jgi:hypothetical protein
MHIRTGGVHAESSCTHICECKKDEKAVVLSEHPYAKARYTRKEGDEGGHVDTTYQQV